MWRPVLSGLLCLPAVILLLLGMLSQPAIGPSRDLTTERAERLPPLRQTVALAISLPATQLSTEPTPELDGWQQVLAEPPSHNEAAQASEEPTPTADVRSKPAHPTPVRAARAFRRKELIVAPPPPSEPARRSQIVWVSPPLGGG